MKAEQLFITELEECLDCKLDKYSIGKINKLLWKFIFDKNKIREEEENEYRNILPNDIFNIVSDISGVPVDKIKNGNRQREIITARHIAMYTIKNIFQHYTLKSIGNMFCGKDHTTVIHANYHVQDMLETKEPSYSNLVAQVNKRIDLLKTKAIV